MGTQTVISPAPTHHAGAYGISMLIHLATACLAVLCIYQFKTTPATPPNDTIELWPRTLVPSENAPADIPPIVGPKIKPLPPLPPVAQETQQQTAQPLGTRMTEREFREKYGRPPVRNNTTTFTKPPVVPNSIKPPTFENLVPVSQPAIFNAPISAHIQNQMDSCFALLAQRIRQAQEKPEGLSSELVVRIEFQVYANGTIGAVKVIRSSGNRAFDDSVLKAIRTVRPIGDRPDGQSGAKVADFRMREED
ncbi:TonB family protein [Ereboglobus sp. PH5-5]|uniref:energy transducer TonB n=1 Tax=unclassified Ereboglobus TaxID=2626932 RepID=UPI0024066CD8|nr:MULTISPECIES: energy transducer TonB [unclassified Ereboglobus]MDF9827012.1 TonB family protein [Ereboglobus sp. PH5-10]MDF9832034.1 TonB family protein [Ereboglobus sp. PH5-5]